jgi:hypothetical protein
LFFLISFLKVFHTRRWLRATQVERREWWVEEGRAIFFTVGNIAVSDKLLSRR